ncbi:hypothetical protein D3C87_504740 [compost metagenome]
MTNAVKTKPDLCVPNMCAGLFCWFLSIVMTLFSSAGPFYGGAEAAELASDICIVQFVMGLYLIGKAVMHSLKNQGVYGYLP